LKLRNRSGALAGSDIKPFVRQQAALFTSLSPEDFVKTLLHWESQIGTVPAVLCGLLAVSGAAQPDKLLAGLEIFDQIYDRHLARFRENDLMALNQFLAPALIFTRDSGKILSGLESLAANLAGENRQVGNCIVCSAFFSLFALRAGLTAGEFHDFERAHSYSYFYPSHYLFDRDRPDNTRPFAQIDPDMSGVASSAFSFIATLLVNRAATATAGLREASPEQCARLERDVAIALLLNPYYSFINRLMQAIKSRRPFSFPSPSSMVEQLLFIEESPILPDGQDQG
jgi:hypothetical protein